MLIDWFTVIAQIINFVVLVLLLRRFLYGPIVKAMEERERRIAEELAAADRKQEQAEQEARRYRKERTEFEEQRRQMLDKTVAEVEVQRKEMIRQARVDAEDARRRWHETIQREQADFLRELRRRTSEHVYTVTRRALADLAEADLERQMLAVFLGKLTEMGDDTRREIVRYAQESDLPVTVYSAFALPDQARGGIVAALQISKEGPHIDFKVRPDLTAGIEIKSPSQRVAWHLSHYLDQLEAEATALIAGETDHNLRREIPEAIAAERRVKDETHEPA